MAEPGKDRPMTETRRDPSVTSLDKLYQADADDSTSWLTHRFNQLRARNVRVPVPPFPKQINVETTNICNHRCDFCALSTMQRPGRQMDPDLFRRLVKEAYDLGTREIGLFAGAEPLTCKDILDHVAFCKSIGYEYIYISTNGALGTPERYQALIDAGLDSIKFSINGGDRETYHRVHGRDDFDKVLANLKAVSTYVRGLDRKVFVGVSSVTSPETEESFKSLLALVGDWVDEVAIYPRNNQAGQMPDLAPPPFSDCENPFAKAHISREGYLRACCNDYENDLALEDLNHMALDAAWASDRFQDLRQRHIDNRLEGTRCHTCLTGCAGAVEPLNPALVHTPKPKAG